MNFGTIDRKRPTPANATLFATSRELPVSAIEEWLQAEEQAVALVVENVHADRKRDPVQLAVDVCVLRRQLCCGR